MRYSIYNELRNRVICMSIVYDEISKGGGGGFDPSQLDPNKLYFKHLENQFLLEIPSEIGRINIRERGDIGLFITLVYIVF